MEPTRVPSYWRQRNGSIRFGSWVRPRFCLKTTDCSSYNDRRCRCDFAEKERLHPRMDTSRSAKSIGDPSRPLSFLLEEVRRYSGSRRVSDWMGSSPRLMTIRGRRFPQRMEGLRNAQDTVTVILRRDHLPCKPKPEYSLY